MPPANRRSVIVREVGDETLVYDLATHRASCLNRGAAAVFHAWDGRRSRAEVASLVSARLGAEIDAAYVGVAVERLRDAGLVDAGTGRDGANGRRDAVRRIAVGAALALPVVTSVLAPEAAQAQTCLPDGSLCTGSGQCCSGCCMASGGMAPECAMGMGNCI